jgi:hypothetical protein
MQNKDISNLVFNIKNELSSITPDVWSEIHKKLVLQVSNDLLEQLSNIPSPNGRLLYERKENILEKIYRIGA